MKTLVFWFSGILLSLSGNFLFAQNIHKDYADGEIYIKLKNIPQGQVILPNGAVNVASELPFLLRATQISSIVRAQRSFYFSKSSNLQSVYRIKISKPKLLRQFIKQIEKDPNVEYAEAVPYYRSFSLPNDTALVKQTYLTQIKAAEAWNVAIGNTDIKVAVIDNAIQATHLDLAANMLPGRDIADNDFDVSPPNVNFWHGTHVAGVIGAVSNNVRGIASMGLNHVKVMPIKASPSAGSPEDITNGYEGIAWAIENGARIINVSWGSAGYSVTEQAVINSAHQAGILVIASMGNEGKNEPYYPAYYNHVIAVASVTSSDERSFFSNYGSAVDLSAPGSAIYSTIPFDTYISTSGTSMAAPVASSVFGYLWSVRPTLTAAELEKLVINTCDDIYTMNPGYRGQLGAGRINALKAVSCLEEGIMPVITPSVTTVICGSSTATLVCDSIAGATYQWKKDGINIGSNLRTFAASLTGSYTVEVTKNTCTIRADSVKITVLPETVNISSTFTTACVGDSIQLTAPNMAGINYQWKKDGVNIGGNAYRFYASQNGNYSVVLSGNGCESIAPSVSLSFITISPVITANGSLFICDGQNTLLSANEWTGAVYQWKKNGENISGATSRTYTANGGGEYVVALQVGQCVAKSDKITVMLTTQQSTSPIVTSREICEGKSLSIGGGLQASAPTCIGSFTKKYQYSGGIVSYDGNNRLGADPTITVSDLDTHKVKKIRVTVTFEKKDQNGINDCDLPHGGSFPFTDEVSFQVKSPDGTVLTLLAAGTYNYYSYNGAITVTFEDGKPLIIPESAPQSGTFAPGQPLATFKGHAANGTWTLLPNDNSTGDPLCVSGFSLEIQVDNFILSNQFTWWTAASGGQQLGVGNEYVATDTQPGVHTYYVQNECMGSCPSTRIPVTLNISIAPLSPPTILAYIISFTLASELNPILHNATITSQNPMTIQNGMQSKVISDRAPMIDPFTICNGSNALLLATGCNGVLRWSDHTTGTGIITAPSATTAYSVRCFDNTSGCLSPTSVERTLHVKPSEISVSSAIPAKGQQIFKAGKATVTSTAAATSNTTVKAGNSVVFLPGFKAEAGSVFTAVIEPVCSQ